MSCSFGDSFLQPDPPIGTHLRRMPHAKEETVRFAAVAESGHQPPPDPGVVQSCMVEHGVAPVA